MGRKVYFPVILLGQLLIRLITKWLQSFQDQFGVGKGDSLKLSLKNEDALTRSPSKLLLASNWPKLSRSLLPGKRYAMFLPHWEERWEKQERFKD